MHYTLRVNEQQFGDLIAAIICAEAAEAEAIELFHDKKELRERAAESWATTPVRSTISNN